MGDLEIQGCSVPPSWLGALRGLEKTFGALNHFLAEQRSAGPVYPPAHQVFAALEETPLEKVKVVLLGQDPYHGPGQAHGLSFSVPDGIKIPPSLRNIFKELAHDMGRPPPPSGNLEKWGRQGVLLLNTTLTVSEGRPASHSGQGWESVTDAILKAVDAQDQPVVFLLLGKHAEKLASFVDPTKHTLVKRSHPSPFSARRNFLGTAPFSEVNNALSASGRGSIDWSL